MTPTEARSAPKKDSPTVARSHWRATFTAVGTGVLVVGLGPFNSTLVKRLKESLGSPPADTSELDRFAVLMTLAMAVIAVAVVAYAVSRIRLDWRRYSLLSVPLLLVTWQIVWHERGRPDEAAVERVHYLLFGVVAYTAFRACRWLRCGRGVALLVATWLWVVAVGTLDELFQWFLARRVGEIYDVGFNAFIGLCGTLAAAALEGLPRSSDWRREWSAVLRSLGLVLVLLALFFHLAHLGYRHVDPDIGVFYSYYRIDELEELDRERQDRWQKENPLPPWSPLHLEDRYLTEALDLRLPHRNAALERGDVYQAWKEQLILEKYYSSALALRPEFGLSEAKRQELEAAQPVVEPYRYSSPAGRYPKRIYVRPSRFALWTTNAIVVTALFLAAAVLGRQHRAAAPS